MRSFIVTAMLILIPLALSWGAAQDYTGDLIFKDGTKTTFTRLSNRRSSMSTGLLDTKLSKIQGGTRCLKLDNPSAF